MACVTSSAVVIPSFTGLKANGARVTSTTVKMSSVPSAGPRSLSVKASWKEAAGVAAIAVAASAILASSNAAMAIDIKLGGDTGELAFVPAEFSVAAGEKITFSNNAGFPHNVVFDEDAVPAGVDAAKISMDYSDYLNGPGETYSVSLTEKGTYEFYCAPHQGAGMVGKVTVN